LSDVSNTKQIISKAL